MMFLARVRVVLKPVVNDPQGLAVLGGLRLLGYESASQVRIGKYIEITLDADDSVQAEQLVDGMCRRLLANPVIEEYEIEGMEALVAAAER